MNLESFACALDAQCEEVRYLRGRVAYLENELYKYDQHIRESNAGYEQLWGKVLDIATDPDSYINKQANQKA